MNLYFMGICGAAMGNVALLMRELGHEVSGADTGVYPPMSTVLEKAGVKVYEGYDAERLRHLKVDRVVVGNVISRGNPELEWLLDEESIPYVSLPQLISEELLDRRHNIVIAGTHGKTTTTTLTAYLMDQLGKNAGYLIGGVPVDLPSGARSGSPEEPFVIEGDEYDSAFFDKRSKFIHYKPSILVINNLEFDHADIFRDLEDVKRTFRHLLRVVPGKGKVLVNGNDENIASLLPINWAQVFKVGVGEGNDLEIRDFTEGRQGAEFTLVWKGEEWGRVKWSLGGLYNARNAAMAALSVGLTISPEDPKLLDLALLSGFRGVKRRQEVLYEAGDLVVLEDFAHHPTALKLALEGLRNRYPGYQLIACVEPRSNTMCLKFHQESLAEALSEADCIYLAPVYGENQYTNEERLDCYQVANRLVMLGRDARALISNRGVISTLMEKISLVEGVPVLVCFFSNGSFGGIIPEWIEELLGVESAGLITLA